MNNNDEIRIVHREDTFNDRAVKELAWVKAKCLCRVQFKRCLENECNDCPLAANYKESVSFMNDYDRARLSSYTAEYYAQESLHFERYMPLKSSLMTLFLMVASFIGALILLFVMLALLSSVPAAEPKRRSSPSTRDAIIMVETEIQETISDLNYDGIINCIDYAVKFKLTWDKYFDPDRCEIVRNINFYKNWHHLFICIDNKIYVEAWASLPELYLMSDNWDDEYNPKYNIYGETDKWLEECNGRAHY